MSACPPVRIVKRTCARAVATGGAQGHDEGARQGRGRGGARRARMCVCVCVRAYSYKARDLAVRSDVEEEEEKEEEEEEELGAGVKERKVGGVRSGDTGGGRFLGAWEIATMYGGYTCT